jgi:hypothetical protein
MSHLDYPQLLFATRFSDDGRSIIYETLIEEWIKDERSVGETLLKGWSRVHVRVNSTTKYELHFTDLVRLQQDAEASAAEGDPCYAEPGLVILTEVTPVAIEAAVRFLWEHKKKSFFSYLKPVVDTEVITS